MLSPHYPLSIIPLCNIASSVHVYLVSQISVCPVFFATTCLTLLSLSLFIPVQISPAHHFYRHEQRWHLQGAGQRDLRECHQEWSATYKVRIQYSRRRRLHAGFIMISKTSLSTSPQFLIIPFTVIFFPYQIIIAFGRSTKTFPDICLQSS